MLLFWVFRDFVGYCLEIKVFKWFRRGCFIGLENVSLRWGNRFRDVVVYNKESRELGGLGEIVVY